MSDHHSDKHQGKETPSDGGRGFDDVNDMIDTEEDSDDESIDLDIPFFKKKHAGGRDKGLKEKDAKEQGVNERNVKESTDAHEHQAHHDQAHHETAHAKDATDAKKPDEDDDLDISFGGSWFNKKHKRPEGQTHHHQDATHRGPHAHAASAEEDEDAEDKDIALDLSFFQKLKKPAYLAVLLILIPLILTIYIRALPAQLPVTDDWAASSVANYYRNQIASQVNAQYPNLPDANKQTLINAQYGKFYEANKAQIDAQVQATSLQFKDQFRFEENNRTITYLGDLDSYFWLRYARTIVTTGSVCDAVIDGRCVDTHMMAPVNSADVAKTLHIYGIVIVYRITRLFIPNYTLMEASFKLPLILALFAAVFAFLLGRKVAGNIGGFFASVLVSVSPVFLSRSLGSDTDVWNITMPLLIFWLFIEAFENKNRLPSILFAAGAGVAIGVFSFAWSGWWYVFDFALVTVFAYIAFTVIAALIRKGFDRETVRELGHDALVLGVFVLVASVSVILFVGFDSFRVSFLGPLGFISIKIASHSNLWPNVYTTVAELNEAGIGTIVGQAGGTLLFFIALFGIAASLVHERPNLKEWLFLGGAALLSLYLVSAQAMSQPILIYLGLLLLPVAAGLVLILFSTKEHAKGIDIKVPLLLIIWFVGTIYAATKGVRFVLLLIPAFSISVSVAIGFVHRVVSRYVHHDFGLKEWMARTIIFIALCALLITPVRAGIGTTTSFLPSINDVWWDSLSAIRERSAPDAIINSWWDFGHWFKYVADRRVTLDGASQNHPNAHWLGLLLQTPDQDQAVALLRMLDCGSNNAFDEINARANDTEIAENIVTTIIMQSPAVARKTLSGLSYTPSEIDSILNATHCSPPEDYLITSDDMIGKAGVWAHFGLWSFDRAYAAVNAKGKPFAEGTALLVKRFNYTEAEAQSIMNQLDGITDEPTLNNWISPWPNYVSGLSGCEASNASNTSTIVTCPLGVGIGQSNNQQAVIERATINMSDRAKTSMTLGFYDQTTNLRIGENTIVPGRLVYTGDTGFERTPIENSTFPYDLLLVRNGEGSYSAMLIDPLLTESTFTKLYFLDGRYMDRFEKFEEKSGFTGTRVIVWKVKWTEDAPAASALADPAKPITPIDSAINSSLQLGII